MAHMNEYKCSRWYRSIYNREYHHGNWVWCCHNTKVCIQSRQKNGPVTSKEGDVRWGKRQREIETENWICPCLTVHPASWVDSEILPRTRGHMRVSVRRREVPYFHLAKSILPGSFADACQHEWRISFSLWTNASPATGKDCPWALTYPTFADAVPPTSRTQRTTYLALVVSGKFHWVTVLRSKNTFSSRCSQEILKFRSLHIALDLDTYSLVSICIN